MSVWRYEERRLRTVQLSLVVAGHGAIDLEMTAAGAQRFAEELVVIYEAWRQMGFEKGI